jgi:LmeA-like phospholipid-binding
VTGPYAETRPYSVPGRSRRGGCLRVFLIVLAVLVVLAVAGDFLAKSFAQNKLASEIQQHGFPKKPSVTIEGFPFLTQVASRDIHQVQISSQDIPEGPVQISKISAVLSGIHLSSGFTSGTVDKLAGSVLITFGSLSNALTTMSGSLGSLVGSSGLSLSAAGPSEVKASLNLVVASASATWQVTRLSPQELEVRLVSTNGIPSSVLSSIRNFTIKIPHLPFGMKIDSVRITPAGVVGRISGHNLPFNGSGGS